MFVLPKFDRERLAELGNGTRGRYRPARGIHLTDGEIITPQERGDLLDVGRVRAILLGELFRGKATTLRGWLRQILGHVR